MSRVLVVADLENRNVTFRSLTEAIDTSTPGVRCVALIGQ
jgi:DNA invertase Pin-like site-specific DNA recombinase